LFCLTSPVTDAERQDLRRIRGAIQEGLDPTNDLLVREKLNELIAEQDLADEEERLGKLPSIPLFRQGLLFWPMAILAAINVREAYDQQMRGSLLARMSHRKVPVRLDEEAERQLRHQSRTRRRLLEEKYSGLRRR